MPERIVARRRADIPASILRDLNTGCIETATLVESFALNFAKLARHTLTVLPEEAHAEIEAAASLGISRRMQLVGALLLKHAGVQGLAPFAGHVADTVRGWVCYAIAADPNVKLKDRFAQIKPFADDPHFGVREWAWLAMRPHIAANITQSVKLLLPWAKSKAANLRRFAVEATRPCGVWSVHIPQLRSNPDVGLPLLEACKADDSRYVQDSVANWLNDAGKTKPKWVKDLCARWREEGHSAATVRICKRALRNFS